MKDRNFALLLPLLSALTFLSTSTHVNAQINWLSWEEAVSLNEEAPRKFVVDVYTEWCGWCKKMDKSTFQNKEIAKYVNENYYAIKFDAEQKEEIEIHEKVYKYVKSGQRGYHELAAEITYGRLSFPTVVFLDENLKVIQPIAGYKDAEKFSMIISYFAEDHHKTTPWKKFCTQYSDN